MYLNQTRHSDPSVGTDSKGSLCKKIFLSISYQVVVNGCDYQPQTASPNKKHAKAMAATVALQAMGEIAGDSVHSGPQFTAATST